MIFQSMEGIWSEYRISSSYCVGFYEAFGNMSKRLFQDIIGTPTGRISLKSFRDLWLPAPGGDPDKYLLIEDLETGDVLIPLVYMKGILESNYSRKLASIKHRIVHVPTTSGYSRHRGLLHWHYAFEAPTEVKSVVKEKVGEKVAQGHLKLVVLPAVYNALSSRFEELKDNAMPLMYALHHAMKNSTYWPLLCKPEEHILKKLDAGFRVSSACNGSAQSGSIEEGCSLEKPIFQGPEFLGPTRHKYMFIFKDEKEMEASKRARTAGNPSMTSYEDYGNPNEKDVDLIQLRRIHAENVGADVDNYLKNWERQQDAHSPLPVKFPANSDPQNPNLENLETIWNQQEEINKKLSKIEALEMDLNALKGILLHVIQISLQRKIESKDALCSSLTKFPNRSKHQEVGTDLKRVMAGLDDSVIGLSVKAPPHSTPQIAMDYPYRTGIRDSGSQDHDCHCKEPEKIPNWNDSNNLSHRCSTVERLTSALKANPEAVSSYCHIDFE